MNGVNVFNRYIWLIDVLRRYNALTFKQISDKWERTEMSLSCGGLDKRTFHYQRAAIFDIFGINIECNKNYEYYISNREILEEGTFNSWALNSFAMLNQIRNDRGLGQRIIFENCPSGEFWLTTFMEAMHDNKVVRIVYRNFYGVENEFEIEPYYLKIYKRRWYVVARSQYYSAQNEELNAQDGGSRPKDVFLIYALDRVKNAEPTQDVFRFNNDFSADEYFRHSCGVIRSEQEPVEIVIKAYDVAAEYINSLPIHHSQKQVDKSYLSKMKIKDSKLPDQGTYFSFYLAPTFEFIQELLSQMDNIEVLSPLSLRDEMKSIAKSIAALYKN